MSKAEFFIVEDKKTKLRLLFNNEHDTYLFRCEDKNNRTFKVFSFGENYELQSSEFDSSYVDRFLSESGVA